MQYISIMVFLLWQNMQIRDAKNPLAKNSDETLTRGEVQVGNGLNLQTGYLLSKTLEISERYTNVSLDKKNTENQYTLGFSKYIAGHSLKVQTDVSYTDIGFSKTNLLYWLQVDIHF
jgi:phosphate-selective porin OprO/OprP